MDRKAVSGIMLSLLFIGVFGSAFNPKPALSSEVYSQEKAPDFMLTDIYGETFCLYNCSARVVLINFFATTCVPSVQQILVLRNVYGNYSRDELEMISISLEDEEVLRNFAEEHGIEWIVARDTAGVAADYGIKYVPTIFIVDAQRYIRYERVGLTEESILRSEIESLLPKTIYVDDDNTAGPWDGTREHPYQNITSGIEHASAGETIYVYNGTYYEHLTIRKNLAIIGENPRTTIIDGNGTGTVVDAAGGHSADNLVISGFTIQNGYGGIDLLNNRNITIKDNIIKRNNGSIGGWWGEWPYGIRVYMTPCISGTTFIGNEILENHIGVLIVASFLINVSNNRIESNSYGIYLQYGDDNVIYHNMITSSEMSGIHVDYSGGNVVCGNIASNNNWAGIALGSSNNNILANNIASNNGDKGIVLGNSNNNVIANNTASNTNYGMELSDSSNNVLVGNTASDNRWSGISLWNSSTNAIYHNNFIDNLGWQAYIPAYPKSYNNTWDDGYSSGGNYWSDYTGNDTYSGPYQNVTGSDGIGDTPYVIDENNTDNYPLMSPYEYWSNPIPGDINRDMKVDHKDLFTLAAAYGSTPETSNWNPHADINGDGKVNYKDLFILAANYGKKYKYP